MAQCTAPIYGHRTESGRANCPVCGGRRYGGHPFFSYNYSTSNTFAKTSISNNNSSVKTKAKWSPNGSTVVYTQAQIRTLTPIRENVEKRAELPDLRDVFLCHAWDDRKEKAKELYEVLKSKGVTVWFSENDVPLGSNLLREIDKGLAKSRVGIVLVTPSFLKRIQGESIADKELSALLARDLLVPIVHKTPITIIINKVFFLIRFSPYCII